MTAPRVGDRFRHARQLDTTWRPGPGQRYADAPHAIMRVTRVATGRVWYGLDSTGRGGFVADVDRLDEVVAEWIEPAPARPPSVRQMLCRSLAGHHIALRAIADERSAVSANATVGEIRGMRTVLSTLRGWDCVDNSGTLTDRGRELLDALDGRSTR